MFNLETLKVVIRQPLAATQTADKYDVNVTVKGGGFTGQAGAIRHGIARAFLKVDGEFRPTLKKAGYLTRDPPAGKSARSTASKQPVVLLSSASVKKPLQPSKNRVIPTYFAVFSYVSFRFAPARCANICSELTVGQLRFWGLF